jgi:hypothetical protein
LYVDLAGQLAIGLNTFTLEVNREFTPLTTSYKGPFIELHPWQRQYIFYFPGVQDYDQDGVPNGYETNVLGTNPSNPDTDGDGYTDLDELYLGLDPTVADRYTIAISISTTGGSSGGGTVAVSPDQTYHDVGTEVILTATPNSAEGYFFWNWSGNVSGSDNPSTLTMDSAKTVTAEFIHESVDTDSDGLTDVAEVNVHGTDPLNVDTDGDTLTDGDEVNVHGTDPLLADTDGDGLTDVAELNVYGTNPLSADTDGDSLTDSDELNVHGTDPLLADTDGDGLADGDEVLVYQTDKLFWDTDGDGFSDGSEVNAGYDPLNPNSHPPYVGLAQILYLPASLAEAGAEFGSAVDLADVDGDGTSELLVAAPLKDVDGLTDVGQVYLFSNDGTLIRTFDNPNPHSGARFGSSLSHLGSDTQKILIGARYQDVDLGAQSGGTVSAAGVVFVFDLNGNHITLQSNAPTADALFGFSVDAANEWPMAEYQQYFDLAGIIVGEPYGGASQEGKVYVFDGTTGALQKDFLNPNPSPNALFGYSVDIQYNKWVDADFNPNLCRINVGAPGANLGQPGQGAVFSAQTWSDFTFGLGPGCDFSGQNYGVSWDYWPSPYYLTVPQQDAAFGTSLSSVDMSLAGPGGLGADENTALLAIGVKGYDGNFVEEGAAIDKYYRDQEGITLLSQIRQGGAHFGEKVLSMGYTGSGWFNNLNVIGAPGQSSEQGTVFLYAKYREGCLDILSSPQPESGGSFGSALSGSQDGFLAVGAPKEDVPGYVDQGKVYLLNLQQRDSDGDSLFIGMELLLGTDPNLSDTDGDYYDDGIEVMFGTDPLDPDSDPGLD